MKRSWIALAMIAFLGVAAAAEAQGRGGRGGRGGGGGGGGGIRIGGGGGGGGGAGGFYRGGGGNINGGGIYRGGGGNIYRGGFGVGNVGPRYGYATPYRYNTGYGNRGGFGLYFGGPAYRSVVPYTVRSTLYSPTVTAIPSYYGTPVESGQTPSGEWGLEVTDITDGPAKAADLRKGDIILGVGDTRTQTLSELQSALAATRGQVELVFINGQSKNVEKLPIMPNNGKIGVAVQPVDVP